MKIRMLIGLVCVAVLINERFGDAQMSALPEKCATAGKKWSDIEQRIFHHDIGALTSVEVYAAAQAWISEWRKLPEEQKRTDDLDLVWYTEALYATDKGEYKAALEFLGKEMDWRYGLNPPTLLRTRDRYFFLELITLEAEILGHLGRKCYPREIDHFFMPIDVDHDGIDEFVALEATNDDEERSISIPPLPRGRERKILYLLVRGDDGHYHVKHSVQVIAFRDKRFGISLFEMNGRSYVRLTGVSHIIRLRHDSHLQADIPIAYLYHYGSTITFCITNSNFEEVHRSLGSSS